MKRQFHPYVSACYINGYVKDTPLRNMDHDEVLHYISAANNQFGRSALKHNDDKVYHNGTGTTDSKALISSV